MLDCPTNYAERFCEWGLIKRSDLIVEDGGLETYSHVTIAFGFRLDQVSPEDVSVFMESLTPEERNVRFSLGKAKIFPANENRPNSDVLYLEAVGSDLFKMNERVLSYFGDKIKPSDFGAYNPHLTLAYVRPGTYKESVKYLSLNSTFISGNYRYSYYEGDEQKSISFSLR